VVNLINKDGSDIGVQAYKGEKYLALTWTATALMFLVSMIECFMDRSTTLRSNWVETREIEDEDPHAGLW